MGSENEWRQQFNSSCSSIQKSRFASLNILHNSVLKVCVWEREREVRENEKSGILLTGKCLKAAFSWALLKVLPGELHPCLMFHLALICIIKGFMYHFWRLLFHFEQGIINEYSAQYQRVSQFWGTISLQFVTFPAFGVLQGGETEDNPKSHLQISTPQKHYVLHKLVHVRYLTRFSVHF